MVLIGQFLSQSRLPLEEGTAGLGTMAVIFESTTWLVPTHDASPSTDVALSSFHLWNASMYSSTFAHPYTSIHPYSHACIHAKKQCIRSLMLVLVDTLCEFLINFAVSWQVQFCMCRYILRTCLNVCSHLSVHKFINYCITSCSDMGTWEVLHVIAVTFYT